MAAFSSHDVGVAAQVAGSRCSREASIPSSFVSSAAGTVLSSRFCERSVTIRFSKIRITVSVLRFMRHSLD